MLDPLAALDHAHLWHPFTPMQQWREQTPLIIERGAGEYLYDIHGRRYLDGISSLWCNVHGHHVPELDQAIRDQLEKVAHTTLLGMSSPPAIELAARLVAIAPAPGSALGPALGQDRAARRLNKVFYSDAGATALEAAFKMAVGYFFHTGQPKRCRFISFRGGYHGDTTGSMSVGFDELFHRPFSSMVFPTHFAPVPDTCHQSVPGEHRQAPLQVFPSQDHAWGQAVGEHCLAELSALLEQVGQETAAVVIEPLMQGAAGMICQPQGFLRGVADLARKHGVLLIADEVATGFGRTGTMFACQQEGVVPDILCLAKGITGGYLPLAATLATDQIEQAFAGPIHERRTLYHGHTYTGNALGCAVALASLNRFERTGLLEHIGQSQQIIHQRLAALADPERFPHVRDVRQRGLMVGIELCQDRATGQELPGRLRNGAQFCLSLRDKGLILRPLGDVIVLMPIPAMGHDSLQWMLDVVIESLATWRPRAA